MEAKNKNILIGGLLAIVLVMAVGYAAFATQLNINGTANITSSWNVAFDNTKNESSGAVQASKTGTGEDPTGTITYDNNNQTANITANLNQPGDKVVFTLTIKNTGSLAATLTDPVMSSADSEATSCSSNECTKGNIKFTMTNPQSSTLEANTGSTTMTVTAEFVGGTATVAQDTSKISINFTANQA